MAKLPRKVPPHDLPPEEQLVAKIEEVRAERRRLVKLPNTATAVGASHKLEADLLKDLRELRAPKSTEQASPVAGMTDAQLLDGLCQAIGDLPDVALERIESAVSVRRTGRPSLRVVAE
jgi:hypothetical protein